MTLPPSRDSGPLEPGKTRGLPAPHGVVTAHGVSRPIEPELRASQRARLVLDFTEGDEQVHEAAEGWARLDGRWVLWLGDMEERWQSWPAEHVVCVEWIDA